MQTYRRTSYGLVDDQGREFPTKWQAVDWIDAYISDQEDGTVLVRYAVDDHDQIDYEWQEGVEFTLFQNGAERDQWIAENLDCCEDCGGYAAQHNEDGSDFVDDWGETIEGHLFRPRVEWDPTKMFWVERYAHGLVRYALTGESSMVDRQWDVASAVGFLTFDDSGWVNTTEAARSILDEYTDWCNGNVYGVVEQVYRKDPHGEDHAWSPIDGTTDACWGFIGTETTENVIKEGL